MTTRSRTRRLLHSAAAATLVVPVSIAAVATPAAATTVLADRWSPGYGLPAYGGFGGGLSQGYGGYGASPYGGSSGTTDLSTLDVSDATTAQSVGVVEISTTIDYGTGEAAGTGILLSSDGLVVTNHHVVEGATTVEVTDVSSGTTYSADVLGYDATKDVAVLRLEDASGLTAATVAGEPATLGDQITAVGDANGDGGSLTAAPGTVTDLRHSIDVSDEQTGATVPLRNLIEVSSDIIPGDSGGALLDAAGEVVGMNVAASSGTADVTGYVIPIARVLRVVDKIEAGDDSGSVVLGGGSAFLGVQLGDASARIAGVVDDSPAGDLGLAAGDTVTAVGGTAVSTAEELSAAIATHEPGDTVTVTWTDGTGATESGSATLVGGPVG